MDVWTGSVDGEPLTRLTSGIVSVCSIFSRDGRWLLFSGLRSPGRWNVCRVLADGSKGAEFLVDTVAQHKPTSLSPDGTILLFNEATDAEDRDIGQAEMAGPRPAKAWLKTPAREIEAAFSPDGKWVAYQSDESGEWEVYVRPYPSGAPQQISIGGGMGPVWNPRGGELFYQTRTKLMSVRIDGGRAVTPPTGVFAVRKSDDYRREFDVAPDGERLLFMEPTARTEIRFVTNWFEELKARVPNR